MKLKAGIVWPEFNVADIDGNTISSGRMEGRFWLLLLSCAD